MIRSRIYLASLLGGSLTLAGLAGCGKSKKDDFEPPPAVALNTKAPPAKIDSPAVPKVAPVEPKPASNKSGFQSGPVITKFPTTGSPLPVVPMPPLPKPKGPPPPKSPPSPFVPPPPVPNPAKTDPEKKDPEPEPEAKKDPKKPFEWPTTMNGRPMSEWIRDISNPDPALRETALRMLPNFGPNAMAPATKAVLHHMAVAYERDPSVRAGAFEAVGAFSLFNFDTKKTYGLDSEIDTGEAIRLLCKAADEGRGTRLHAVQTLAKFGPRAESAIPFLVGQNMTHDPAYQTRQAIASTLGAIAFNKEKGPSERALHCLIDVLIKDKSAAVRLGAYQSIVTLGPPLLPAPKVAPGTLKPKPTVDLKAARGFIVKIKARLLPYKREVGVREPDSPTGLMERDKQVEIFARFTMMRFDPKEANLENLKRIAKYVHDEKDTDSGPKLQALYALGMMGPASVPVISDVVQGLEDEDPNVVMMAVSAIVAMGKDAEPAIEFLEKLKKRGDKKDTKPRKDFLNSEYIKLAQSAIDTIKKGTPMDEKPVDKIPADEKKPVDDKKPVEDKKPKG